MGLFSLKSRKSYSSDTSSFSKHKSDANKNNLEASDVIGDSPDFGHPNNRRGPSYNTDTASLRSRSSMKKFFGSTRRKGSSIDVGGDSPQRTKTATSSDYFNGASANRASRTSINKPSLTPGSPPVLTPASNPPTLGTPAAAAGTSFADAVGQSVSGGLATTTPAGPRPSELFAGKGVQWEAIDLTSRDLTKPTDAPTNVDMQKFLKERRQWIPTFKEEDTVEEDAAVNLPKSLDQFSFETPAEIAKSSAGLKDLRDLEDTHKRKAALLNPAPLASAANGTIFEEAGPSTSIIGASDAAAGVKTTQSLPPPPPAPSRNQSFRTSTFAASSDTTSQRSGSISRKPAPVLGVNGSSSTPSTAASRDIPQRRSSVRKELSDLGGASTGAPSPATETPAALAADTAETSKTNGVEDAARPANSRVEQIKEQAATGSVRPSMETAGFATPAGSQSESDAGAHTSAAPVAVPATVAETSQDTGATVAATSPVGETPPRPPKNEHRPPSRQSSQDQINSGVSKSPSTNFASTVESVAEKVTQAAPPLQNVLPGGGAATNPPA